MRQFIFVRRGDQVASWKWQRGKLRIAALNGNDWSELSPAYWEEWKDANQVSDGLDAILLSDAADGFGLLPDWLSTASEEPSEWTFEQISDLADDEAFDAAAFVLTQGEVRRTVGAVEADSPVAYAVRSTCRFTLPKEEPKPAEPEPVEGDEDAAPGADAMSEDAGDTTSSGESAPSSFAPGASLLEIKRNADARKAEEDAKREKALRFKKLNIHPLVKRKCDRSVRDAYFKGIVFAALTDDLQVDEIERPLLSRIGSSLAIPSEDRRELVTYLQDAVNAAIKSGGEGVFAPLEECVKTLKEEPDAQIFVAEYVKVCGAHGLDGKSVREQFSHYIRPFVDAQFKLAFDTVCRVVERGKDVSDEDLATLADAIGDETVRYLMLDVLGDVGERFSSGRARNAAERARKKEIARREKVCEDFGKALDEIGESYKGKASLSDSQISGIEGKLDRFDKNDINVDEFSTRLVKRLTALSNATYEKKRKVLWGLIGLFVFAGAVRKDYSLGYFSSEYTPGTGSMLVSARVSSHEGFIREVNSFVDKCHKRLSRRKCSADVRS